MSSQVIRDGQTREGYILAIDRLYDELSFTYRPMLAETHEELAQVRYNAKAKDAITLTAEALAKHIEKWSDDAKIEYDSVRRLPPRLLDKLYAIIAGQIPTDERKGASTEDLAERAAAVRASVSGTTPQKDQAKNSAAA